jgi:tRNA-specific 2-thiouridylase
MKSKDENKDQTYFLWMLTDKDLEHVLFPIGHMVKDEVRKEAEKRSLYTSDKKDSQGLCFVGSIDLKTLLKEYIQEEKGDVCNESGEIIGMHDGVMFYTIGERHGFTITKRSTSDTPYYVIGKDLKNNTLLVSHTRPATEMSHQIPLEKVSFVNAQPEEGKVYEARGRYRAPLAKVSIKQDKEAWTVTVLEGELVYTSGQSLVIYDGEICLGGGIMK